MRCETVVIGLNWVGDNVLALPSYRALQHRFRGDGGIAVAAPVNMAPLLEATGIFKHVIAWEKSTARRVAALRRGCWRRAVILPSSFRSAAIVAAAGIGERWGYATDWRRPLLNRPVQRPAALGHQLDDYTALLAALNAPRVVGEVPALRLSPATRERGRGSLLEIGVHLDRPLIGIHAGGLYGRAKHWGDDRYVEILKLLRLDGLDVVLLTSPGEREQAQGIATRCNGVAVVGREGDVLALAAAISHCDAVITNDSGPLHLAAALGVPAVSIFGPTDPERTVIPGTTRVVRGHLECQPCYQRQCPLGHHQCMTEISVDDVLAAVWTLLPASLAPPRLALRRAQIGEI